jgi:hypothetical protein
VDDIDLKRWRFLDRREPEWEVWITTGISGAPNDVELTARWRDSSGGGHAKKRLISVV